MKTTAAELKKVFHFFEFELLGLGCCCIIVDLDQVEENFGNIIKLS